MKISIQSSGEGQILAYAKQELIRFLEKYSNAKIGNFPEAEREIVLKCGNQNVGECDGSYQIVGARQGTKNVITIASDCENGVLTGVYRVLEEMGICFQMNGPILNGFLDVAACDGRTIACTPFVRHRGIRQHINFPMDISSYHIEEAEEYIRNLARMGLNSITFHSYTGQWHGYTAGNKTVYAGNYFYGQRHVVPEDPAISGDISNRKYYCIPEIEEQLSDEEARHEFSIRWLNRLMRVCKQAGLRVTFSMELPEDESTEHLVSIVRGVLQSYPLIDTIEWISPEGGGQGPEILPDELLSRVKDYFGVDSVAGVLPYVPDELPESLPGAMASLKRAVDLYGRKEEIFAGMMEKQIAVGMYVMCKETLKFLKQLMMAVLPGEVLFSFLPAHGSMAVADNVEFMEFTKEELQRTMIYSWIEFDGNMYLQQNSSKGIQAILERTAAATGGDPVYGMCFNHWRTAENEIVAGYMAKAAMEFETTGIFYKKYAGKLGIGEVSVFTETMELLEEIDCFNRDNLFNIGFCYLGCWLAPAGLGWIRNWKETCMQQAIEKYEEVLVRLENCLANTRTCSGIECLRLFINRVQCSIFQIKAIQTLHKICAVADDGRPEELNEEEKNWIGQQCDRALDFCRQYLDLHMKLLPDRGCQGTAVSYYATIPVYVDHIRQYFVYGEQECTHQPETLDAPPPPDTAYLK